MRESYERAYTSRIIWELYYPAAKDAVDAQWAARVYDERELNARRLMHFKARRYLWASTQGRAA